MTNSFVQGGIDPMATAAVASAIERAKRIAIFTGAGISADSGLPTYRGIGGLYNDLTVDEGLPIEVVLSGDMFRQQPQVTWKYIAEIERACRGAQANDAHRIIAELDALAETWVITQNVDGFHNDAGSEHVIELHGNLRRLICTECERKLNLINYAGISIPPSCDDCGAIMRPDVVLFGELLPDHAMLQFEREIARGFDLVFSVGTSAGFPYIYQPVIDAAGLGLTTVEINPEETGLSEVVSYRMGCGAALAFGELRRELVSRGRLHKQGVREPRRENT